MRNTSWSLAVISLLFAASSSATTIQRVLDYDFGRAFDNLEQRMNEGPPPPDAQEPLPDEPMEDPGEDEGGELLEGSEEEFPESPAPVSGDLDCTDEDHDHSQPKPLRKCQRATKKQRAYVNLGNRKQEAFLAACAKATRDSAWCQEIMRPNPASRSSFACTYGWTQPHMLIHPDPASWKFAFEAIKIADELIQKGIHVCGINNWWRPEPYNRNVGGAKGRHPLATSVDVRFCTKEDQVAGFPELCKMRAAGRLRAVGFYPGTVLHFGVGDRRGNTWGNSCSSF